MDLFDIVLTAVALAMDAFAVAVCKGLAMRLLKVGDAVICGLYFGIAQAVMPIAGYFFGISFEDKIKKYDHWIAFVLLALIGLKMIVEVVKERKNGECHDGEECGVGTGWRQMFPLAIATSIDALAVGVSFAFLGVEILSSAAVIGIITFTLSFIGVGIGCFFGLRFRKIAQLTGGITLIVMGIKILAEHTLAG